MHLQDIHDVLARKDVSAIEDAFRALVGWPGEDAITDSTATQRKEALDLVLDALAGDMRIMPSDTFNLILDVCDGDVADRTYSAGAAAVRSRIGYFCVILKYEGRSHAA